MREHFEDVSAKFETAWDTKYDNCTIYQPNCVKYTVELQKNITRIVLDFGSVEVKGTKTEVDAKLAKFREEHKAAVVKYKEFMKNWKG